VSRDGDGYRRRSFRADRSQRANLLGLFPTRKLHLGHHPLLRRRGTGDLLLLQRRADCYCKRSRVSALRLLCLRRVQRHLRNERTTHRMGVRRLIREHRLVQQHLRQLLL